MKVEAPVKDKKKIRVKSEYKIYKTLREDARLKSYTAKIYFFGQERTSDGKLFNLMIMDLLGPCLEELFYECGKKLDLETILNLGVIITDIIKKIHEKGIVYRDIKPDNFLTSIDRTEIYICDFGLAKHYMIKNEDSKENEQIHRPMSDGKSLIGTPRFASINTHIGLEQSRRDDLESFGYMLVYLLKGKLPWSSFESSNQMDIRFIKE